MRDQLIIELHIVLLSYMTQRIASTNRGLLKYLCDKDNDTQVNLIKYFY